MTNNPKHAFNSATKTYDDRRRELTTTAKTKQKKSTKYTLIFFHTNDRQTDGRHYNWNSNKSGTTDNKNNHGINNNWRDKQQQNTIRATGHIIWSISWWVVCKQFSSPTNTMMMMIMIMMIGECAKHTHTFPHYAFTGCSPTPKIC